MKDIEAVADIPKLVDTFYSKVLKDEVIGHFFTEVVQLNMEAHMPKMYAFWESILFGTGPYHGNPMTKHIALNSLSEMRPEHFKRWLVLWEDTVGELFSGDRADLAITRAQNIAAIMELKVGQSV
jgi:hemoglobin